MSKAKKIPASMDTSTNEALGRRIRPVTSRLRKMRFWRTWTVAALALAAIGMLILQFASFTPQTFYTILVLGITFFAITLVWAARSYRDVKGVASRIEKRFPSLDQRLITAVDQRGDELGYLQQKVIREARDHSRANAWPDVVSKAKLFWSRMLGLASTAFLGLVLASLSVSEAKMQASASIDRTIPLNGVEILPGNTEVERGSAVIVTARFGQDFEPSSIPTDGELVGKSNDGSTFSIPMRRNLGDPVLAALLSSAESTFDYQIKTPIWQSDTYHVEVFDYPAMLRSDASLDYPSYTSLEDKTIQDTVRVSAVRGTKVTWVCRLNKSVELAELVEAKSQNVVVMDIGDDQTASVTMTLEYSGTYVLRLVDDLGRENKVDSRLTMKVLDNGVPKIELIAGGDASVSPLQEFLVRAKLQDDFGLVAAGLSYTLGSNSPVDISFKKDLDSDSKDFQVVETTIDLEKLEAQEDQLLTYHLWADDIGPEGSQRRIQGDIYFADVRPFEQIFRKGDPPPGGESPPSQGEQQAGELAELQKEIISATWKLIGRTSREKDSPEFDADVQVVAQSQSDALDMLAELQQKLNDSRSKEIAEQIESDMTDAVSRLTEADLAAAQSSEQAAYGGLLKLRSREFNVSRQKQQSQGSSSKSRNKQKQLDELELDQDENRYETQSQAQKSAEQEQAKANRQVMNRLKELSRRQTDLNRVLAELQTAIRKAETEEEREEIERRLKRLREQQKEMLRDMDELAERMEQQSQQSGDENADSQKAELQKAREDVRKAGEAIENEDPGSALASGAKAGERLEQLRDEIREASAGQFDEGLRQMQSEAEELQERQEKIAEQLANNQDNDQQAGLRAGDESDEIAEEIDQQSNRLKQLTDDMQAMVEQAEATEPLLAEKLYDGFKAVQKQEVETRLQQAKQLNELGFDRQAREAESMAREGINQLKQAIDDSAKSVLGSSEKALQEALATLERLEDQIAGQQSSDSNDGGNQPAEAQQASNTEPNDTEPNDTQPSNSSQNGPPQASPEQSNSQQPGNSASQNPQSQTSQQGSPRQGSQPGQPGSQPSSPNNDQRPSVINQLAANNESGPASPVTGDGFREFSDSLRDVEEMVDRPELKSRAAQIRDRTREMRVDYRRNSKAPSTDKMEELIATPLRELRRDVAEELMRRSAERNAMVPIDRDPVPNQFNRSLEVYYKRLGISE
ncbi:hypothetical protein Pla22_51890 [Rubripirellula amarantea]|uniref:Uncharacterized protein n=1 Tax=Rubripirellula amarantea TaxID=2527999 RepID=A0A5C5WBE2_9BACT|nr:proline-rich domain-containing protein [Rubripirellula amarantea]TWT48188.1 hypothetical protein Pla22_51890 [Rubripirellula amarantea]